MERFTYRVNGEARMLINGDLEVSGPLPEHLSAYEDTGLMPADIKAMRNELCLKCGKYEKAHEGACNGCKWLLKPEG